MKNISISLISILFILLSSCKKEQNKILVDNPIIASWQWTHSTGGIAVHTVPPSANTLVILNFYNDGTYTAKVNGQVTAQGSFSLVASGNFSTVHFDKTIVADRLLLQIDERINTLENGKLVLQDHNISDGFGHYFDLLK